MTMKKFEVSVRDVAEKKVFEADSFSALSDIVTLYRQGIPVAAFVNWVSILQLEPEPQ